MTRKIPFFTPPGRPAFFVFIIGLFLVQFCHHSGSIPIPFTEQ